MLRLTPGVELLLQPNGSFLSFRLTNSFEVLDRAATGAVLASLTRERLSENGARFIERLVDGGYLTTGTPDPEQVLFADQARHMLKAVRAEIEVTNRCNLHCRYCYAEVNRSREELTLDEWTAILDGMIGHGLRAVLFSGGEPFLHPAFLDLLEAVASRLIVEINTNGQYISREVAGHLRILALKRVQLSMDSASPEYHDSLRGRGSHSAAVRAAENLREADVPVLISMVVTQQNKHTISDMASFANSLGADFKADPITRSGFAKAIPDAEWETMFRVTRSDRLSALVENHTTFIPLCQSQVGFVAVSFQGILKPCNMREAFFSPTGDRLLQVRSKKWWERFYGEQRIGLATSGAARTANAEGIAIVRARTDQYLCELQAAILSSPLGSTSPETDAPDGT